MLGMVFKLTLVHLVPVSLSSVAYILFLYYWPVGVTRLSYLIKLYFIFYIHYTGLGKRVDVLHYQIANLLIEIKLECCMAKWQNGKSDNVGPYFGWIPTVISLVRWSSVGSLIMGWRWIGLFAFEKRPAVLEIS